MAQLDKYKVIASSFPELVGQPVTIERLRSLQATWRQSWIADRQVWLFSKSALSGHRGNHWIELSTLTHHEGLALACELAESGN